MRNVLIKVVTGALLVLGSSAFAGEPVVNISPKLHPNLAAAQRLSRKAFDKITAAQKANEFDMEGHAQKAKELLAQANAELKQAAEEANENKKK